MTLNDCLSRLQSFLSISLEKATLRLLGEPPRARIRCTPQTISDAEVGSTAGRSQFSFPKAGS